MIAQSQGRVTSVTSAADALQSVIATDGKAIKIAALRATRKAVEHLEQQPADKILAQGADLKAHLQSMQIADGSSNGSVTNLQLNVLSQSFIG